MVLPTETVDDLFGRFGRQYRVLVTLSGMSASFIMVLSGTIVNVAVPDVMGAYGVGQDRAQLLATAFNVAMTTCQLLNAWVVAVFGQRYGFTLTLILFTIGSFVAGFCGKFRHACRRPGLAGRSDRGHSAACHGHRLPGLSAG